MTNERLEQLRAIAEKAETRPHPYIDANHIDWSNFAKAGVSFRNEFTPKVCRELLDIIQRRGEALEWTPVEKCTANASEPALVLATNFKHPPAVIWMPNGSGWNWQDQPTHFIDLGDLPPCPHVNTVKDGAGGRTCIACGRVSL